MPRRSAGTAARSKPAPRSRTNTDDGVVVRLRVDGDLVDAGELRGVRHRLARGEHELADARRRAARRLRSRARCGRRAAPRRRPRPPRARRRAMRRRADAAAVEPAAQLALLAARERGDARGLVGVPLDERERLQDGVVDARGDLGALLEPDALGALGARAARATARARAASAPATAPGATKARRARRRGRGRGPRRRIASAIAEHRQRAAGPERAAAQRGRRPGRRRGAPAPSDARCARGRARSAASRRRAASEDGGGPGAPSVGVDPEREVEEDPGAAREREQREDEPDERRVDAERRASPPQTPGDDAVVVAALERGAPRSAQSPRPHHVDPAGADASRRSRAGRRVPVWTAALRPSSCWPRT